MTRTLEFTSAARAEFDEAFGWYADRSFTAALGFANEVDVAIESIIADPGRFVRTFSECQVCRLRRYPYSVVFHALRESIVVVAIAHASRRPDYWHHRLEVRE